MATRDDGWAFLAMVGSHLRHLNSAFDPRSYGHTQLSGLFRSRPDLFELRESETDGGPSIVSVRPKP